MPMANPPHPGFSIADELDALGLSTAEGAAALGVTRQQLHRLVSGKSAISPEMALRLETVIGSSAETWARMQAAYDIAQVRRRAADVTAGLKRIA